MKVQTNIAVMIVVIVVLALIGLFVIGNYNGIVTAEKMTEEGWAQIEVVCQRRLDLIPNLIETVKAYAQHEKSTLEAVMRARNHAKNVLDDMGKKSSISQEDLAVLAASEAQVTQGIRGIFALVENYPDLKASANFMALQDQFEGTENRISVARQRYNSVVRLYNTKIAVFPGNIIAAPFGFEEKGFFEAKKEAMEPVKAQF